jgi:GABA permease
VTQHSIGAPQLRNALHGRHISMIAIGGTIGTGLFIGNGMVVQQAGPAVILAYLAIGAVLVLIMRMLGTLAAASPDPGSYTTYAARHLGPWVGVMTSYLAVYSGIILIALECSAIGSILNGFVLTVPVWEWSFLSILVLGALNLLPVRVFAELEYWMAIVKVIAVVVFLAVGVLALLGWLPDYDSPGLSHWAAFAPAGWLPVLLTAVTVLFSYMGTENVAVVAAEARDPQRALGRAIRSVVTRILVFYIGSTVIVITVVPSFDPALSTGAYAAVLNALHLPLLASAIQIVVATSILSLANSSLYTTSRLLFAAARRGETPARLGLLSTSGTPVWAAGAVGGVAALVLLLNFLLPAADVISLLISVTGAGGVLTYTIISLTFARAQSSAGRSSSTWMTWVVLAVLAAVAIALAVDPTTRLPLLLTIAAATVCAAIGVRRQHLGSRHTAPHYPPPGTSHLESAGRPDL